MILKIEKVVSGGDGLGFDGESAVFVSGTLPGEIWEIEVTERKKGFKRGKALHLKENAHPNRVQPKCPYYQNCGGCDFQHLDHPGQLDGKVKIITESFKRIGKIEPPQIIVHAGTDWGYRSRIQLHFDGTHWGYRGRSSDRLVVIDSCPIATGGINRFLKTEDKSQSLEPGRYTVFGDDNQWHLESHGKTISLSILGKVLEFSLEGFFQSNLPMTEVLLSLMVGYFTQGAKALDLYAGAGLFGSFLEDFYTTVLSVEENPKAAALGKKNLQFSAKNFTISPVEPWIAGLLGKFSADLIVADPPRTGLSSDVVNFLNDSSVPILLYVSCNPDTMARDSGNLVRGGWKLKDLHFLDFYPQTTHMETLGVFEKSP